MSVCLFQLHEIYKPDSFIFPKERENRVHSFHFQVTEEEKLLVEKLPQLWYDLVLKSKNIDASLVAVSYTHLRAHET